MTSYSDALDREIDWLTAVDTLPALLAADGGPFAIAQARWPRTMAKQKRALYLTRMAGHSAEVDRFANVRQMMRHRFVLHLMWPLNLGTGKAEDEQLAFEQAIDKVLARVLGLPFDKTHGGRFLSVAEGPEHVVVEQDDPAQGIAEQIFTARITYSADDPETTN